MLRPNIFEYAKRELSQDAIICWILECLNSDDQDYKELGLNFVRFIFDNKNINKVKLINNTPKLQHNKIDVYVEILLDVDKKVHPVIFEDKTNTYLHNDQLYKYIQKTYDETKPQKGKKHFSEGETGEILYVYYKTGYASEWQQSDLENKKKEVLNWIEKNNYINNVSFKNIYLEDIIRFLEANQIDDTLLNDYISYLKKSKDILEKAKRELFTSSDNCNNALKIANEYSSVTLLERIFGNGCWVEYTPHQQRCIVYPFYTFNTNDTDLQDYRIFYNLGIANNKNEYYFRFKQWRKESKCKDALTEKIKEANYIQKLCKEIAKEIDSKGIIDFKNTLKESNYKTFDSQRIFKIPIDGNATPEEICQLLNKFIEQLIDKIKKDSRVNIQTIDYKKEKCWENNDN